MTRVFAKNRAPMTRIRKHIKACAVQATRKGSPRDSKTATGEAWLVCFVDMVPDRCPVLVPHSSLTKSGNLQRRNDFLGLLVIGEQGNETQRAKSSSSTLSGDMLNVLSGSIELHLRLQRSQVYMLVQRAASSSCEILAFTIETR